MAVPHICFCAKTAQFLCSSMDLLWSILLTCWRLRTHKEWPQIGHRHRWMPVSDKLQSQEWRGSGLEWFGWFLCISFVPTSKISEFPSFKGKQLNAWCGEDFCRSKPLCPESGTKNAQKWIFLKGDWMEKNSLQNQVFFTFLFSWGFCTSYGPHPWCWSLSCTGWFL